MLRKTRRRERKNALRLPIHFLTTGSNAWDAVQLSDIDSENWGRKLLEFGSIQKLLV